MAARGLLALVLLGGAHDAVAHSEDDLRGAATKYFDTFNSHDATAVAQTYASNGAFYDWSMHRDEPAKTRTSVLGVVSGIFNHVPAVHTTLRALHVSTNDSTVTAEVFVYPEGVEKASNFMTVLDVLEFDDELLLSRCHRYKMHDWTVFFHRGHKFGTLGVASQPQPSADALKEKAVKYFDAFNAHLPAEASEMFSPTARNDEDGLLHDWTMDPNKIAKTRAAVKSTLTKIFADVPQIELVVKKMHVSPASNSVTAELEIFPAGQEEDEDAYLTVVDVLEFDDELLLRRLHAYRMHDVPKEPEAEPPSGHTEL